MVDKLEQEKTRDELQWLSWTGYSEKKRISLSGWSEEFSRPSPLFESLPYCKQSYNFLSGLSKEKRLAIQNQLFDRTAHSVPVAAYMGVIKSEETAFIRKQLELCLHTIIRLMQIASCDRIEGKVMTELFAALPELSATELRSALESSLYFYANGKLQKPFKNVLIDPLYLELGIDILCNRSELCLAEFQVRYSTPYPHLLQDMSEAYAGAFPVLFERFGLKKEGFSQRRKALLEKALETFSARAKEKPEKLLLDAWAYLENAGANLKPTASELGMEYLLFDDLLKDQNIYERAYRNKRLVIFNQAPLNLLDPQDLLFGRVNVEKFENYDELAWLGLLERYLRGQVFLSNSPMSDLLNDKALYSTLPALSKLFFDRELELEIVKAKACWSCEDFARPDNHVLSSARKNKDKSVIAHRYLEGGLGILVGPATSQEEWESFIDTFVSDRPYLYVVRDYFEMDPDFSMRQLAAVYAPEFLSPAGEFETEFSDSIYGRVTAQPPLSSDNHKAFLLFEQTRE